MEIAALTDNELLAAWVKHRDEAAFHALVSRYAGLVHSAAKRSCGDDSLAAEASQLTFILLTRKANSLLSRASLGGWLYLTAVGEAKNLLRSSTRENRKRSALLSAMAIHTSDEPDPSWQEFQPFLNDALAALSEKDRETIILRFYRSLSVREIAATLGIATDAAQKRLDRATERLREKLTRRGVTTTGSLSAVMLAGFSTDANAAIISTSILSSKAIAASAVTPTSVFATLFAMKATSYIAPAVILICGGLFLNHQSQVISRVEKESAATRAAIDAHALQRISVNSKAKPPAMVEQIKEGAIDWNQIAQKIARTSFDSWENKLILEQLRKRVQTLSREELVSACDSLGGLECPAELHQHLLNLIMAKLGEMDPAYVLDRFSGQIKDANNRIYQSALSNFFRKWAIKDLEQAKEWLDSADASGKFASPGVTGYTDAFRDYKGSIAKSLFAKDRIAGADYLRALPPELRTNVIEGLNLREFPLEVRVDYVALIRSLAPKWDQPRLIAETAFENASGSSNGSWWPVDKAEFPKIAAYLKGISATDTERSGVISYLARLYSGNTDGREDARAWVKEQSPQDLDAFTGIMLSAIGRGDFEKAAKIVRGYHDEGAGDDLITRFLDGVKPKDSPTARELASRIKDLKARENILKNLKP
jgi:RNA polymerase sigma factor (sigma-70 family)